LDDRERPTVVATCTLVKIDDNEPYLLNAGHTLKNNNIFICLPGNTIELPFATKSKSTQFDKLDIAVTPLYGDFGRNFYDYNFLPLDSRFNREEYDHLAKRIMFFGFPASQANVDIKKGAINARSTLITLTEAENLSAKNLEKEHFDLDLHVIAHFPRRKMRRTDPEVITGPLPHGMSGGPVFEAYVTPGEKEDEFVIANFVGIGTDYISNFAWLKATKKEAILDFIVNV
jgi:hypothetical protein